MSSEIKADKWSPASGTSATIGDSGDTYTIPSGVTLNTSSATLTLPSTVITGQTAKTSLVDADKFLISDSAASGALKYVEKQYLPSGGLVHLGTSTISGNVSELNVDYFSSSYRIHKIFGTLSGDTSGQDYYVQWRNGGSADSSNVYTTSIGTNLQANGSSTSTTDYGAWNGTYMMLVSGTHNNNTTPARFQMTIYDAMGTTYNSGIEFISAYYRTSNQWATSTGTMNFNDGGSNTFEGLRFYPSANNFDDGEIRVYGVVDS